jgi:hypothetical protein
MGLPVNATKVGVYALCGFFSALSGITHSIYVGGGHRLAPGFQIRGFVGGKKSEPVTQMIYVEYESANISSGSKLNIKYSYVTGQYNYYEKDAHKVAASWRSILTT